MTLRRYFRFITSVLLNITVISVEFKDCGKRVNNSGYIRPRKNSVVVCLKVHYTNWSARTDNHYENQVRISGKMAEVPAMWLPLKHKCRGLHFTITAATCHSEPGILRTTVIFHTLHARIIPKVSWQDAFYHIRHIVQFTRVVELILVIYSCWDRK